MNAPENTLSRKIIFYISLLLLSLMVTGCATNKSNERLVVDDSQYLKIGETTKRDVVKLGGYPLFASTYNKEDAIKKVKDLVQVEIDDDVLGENKHTVWLYPTYENDKETPAGFDMLFLFDDMGVLKQTFTH